MNITVGVLALQGAFAEHIYLLIQATKHLPQGLTWHFVEVRTPDQLAECDALILPGGESTTMSLVAARSGMLEPLRQFVKVHRRPTWGTCAGLILLAESANRTKKGGQDLIGGLDVRVNRNHFGRQTESFTADLDLPFLSGSSASKTEVDTRTKSFRSVFIRAPIVERILPHQPGAQDSESRISDTVVAPSRPPAAEDAAAQKAVAAQVEVMARLPGRATGLETGQTAREAGEEGDIVAVRQGNVFGTSFHPELTGDERIHVWWLKRVGEMVSDRRGAV
ncbi:hypothetical protein B0A49_07643 [Cryomyces minteri]|uniref:glutaminase n=1 Tax=Cryomyces minteri TaxID=331657 RepID=A0A4U0WXP0_9PEZI|nr:hypothetical protein B0A49_07643 [Cryomyces minteri]